MPLFIPLIESPGKYAINICLTMELEGAVATDLNIHLNMNALVYELCSHLTF